MPLLTRTRVLRWFLPALTSVICVLSAQPAPAQTTIPEPPLIERADALLADGLADGGLRYLARPAPQKGSLIQRTPNGWLASHAPITL